MNSLLNNIRLYHDQAERAAALARKETDRTRHRILSTIADHLYMLHDDLVVLGNLDHLPDIPSPSSAPDGASATDPQR